MEYFFLIVSSMIILTCFYFIISPFFTLKGEIAGVKADGEEYPTLESLYRTVNELEMDYLMKKMTEKDFKQLKEQYQALAAQLMKQEIQQNTYHAGDHEDKEAELEILNELQKIRTQKGR